MTDGERPGVQRRYADRFGKSARNSGMSLFCDAKPLQETVGTMNKKAHFETKG